MRHEDFYADTLQQLIQRRLLMTDMSILVVCGGVRDRDVFHELGFQNVTISNLETRREGKKVAPFEWACLDAESLALPDDSYDWVVAHSGLHHCYSPHRGLLEMYRVARRGILVLEPRDSVLVRLGVRLSFGQDYEVAAVALSDKKAGGVRNTCVPNYVYRWSEREIEKTLRSYVPTAPPRIHYFYALRVPQARLDAMRNRVVAGSIKLLLPLIRLTTALFPKQCNNFAFAAEKLHPGSELHPWLSLQAGEIGINDAWVARHYRNSIAGGKSVHQTAGQTQTSNPD